MTGIRSETDAMTARLGVVGGCAVGGGLVLWLSSAMLGEVAATMWLGPAAAFPLTIQFAEWLVFFAGLGEAVVRLRAGRAETGQLARHYLPEDHGTVLRGEDLEPIYRRVHDQPDAQVRFLPRLILSTIRSFRCSGSIDQANALMGSGLELFMHEIDLRYTWLRYMVWLIPSLGFIGTVVGIAAALRKASGFDLSSTDINVLALLTEDLGVAFDTTMLALVLSMVLVLLMSLAQAREETALNRAGQYCLNNLVNRLY
ncbi:MotA/TolQ/ExbB proton channel family protein [Magnetospirillum sp. SS-4]|uniref:MotA/TolQ/ExbB proton channel family protein n=1 Tax=Magnetospirillum sp. SS-4 TaxID=2681465 RepID=UPI001384F5A1|nr:MotA/TolQ/ExbB proton channel family protein [Magnetospirillum sp. SS-4]CAA7617135.1 conserved membrane hypothetical protein [Magnetospirillum sp. SS-4]